MLGNSDVRRQQAALLLHTLTLDLGADTLGSAPHIGRSFRGGPRAATDHAERARSLHGVFEKARLINARRDTCCRVAVSGRIRKEIFTHYRHNVKNMSLVAYH
jgi:hypothetical protein